MNQVETSNQKGRQRTVDENKLIFGAIKLLLTTYLDLVDDNKISIHDISWAMIERQFSTSMSIRPFIVSSIRKQGMEEGMLCNLPNEMNDVVVDEATVSESQVSELLICSDPRSQLDSEMVQSLVDEVDRQHSNGKTVTNQLLRNYLVHCYNVKVCRKTMAKYMSVLGLSWQPVKAKKRNVGAYRMDLLRDYLINFSNLYVQFIRNPEECDFVFVFTDETYVHRNHSSKNSYMSSNSTINRSSSKGQRLVILHAITPFGPLCEREENGVPVSDLKWNGDTPHSKELSNGKLTCELMWKAQSSSGDYHDNMNPDMFMKWTTNKLVPTFERLHPNKKMILICDNAAYHHKRELGSLSNFTKNEILELCIQHNVEYIDIPMTEIRHNFLEVNEVVSVDVTDDNDCRVPFEYEKMKGRSSSSTPFVPSLDELKFGVLQYIRCNKPELLECKVEKLLMERGHSILWTPPYTPDLQPIENFWGAGKNHAAQKNFFGIKMKETVAHVREGWYGNLHLFDNLPPGINAGSEYELQKKKPVDCMKLFKRMVSLANTKFVPMCMGISGTMEELTVDTSHEPVRAGIPIDILVSDMCRLVDYSAGGDDSNESDIS